jgi:hypothetical protein
MRTVGICSLAACSVLLVDAQKAGAYRLDCRTHAPSMTVTIMVLPR